MVGAMILDKNGLFQALGYLGVKDIGSPSPENYPEYVALVTETGGTGYAEQELSEAAALGVAARQGPSAAKMNEFWIKKNALEAKILDPNVTLTTTEEDMRQDLLLFSGMNKENREKLIDNFTKVL